MIKLTTPCTAEVITDTARSNARALQTPGHVSRTGRDSSNRGHCDIYARYPRLNSPVLIGGTNVSSTRTGTQEIVIPYVSTGSLKFGDIQIFDTPIHGTLDKDGDYTPIFSKIIGGELSHNSNTDIYSRCRVDFTSNTVRTEAPDFMNLGLPEVNASDELRSFGSPATRVGIPTDGSNWSAPGHVFGEVTAVGMSGTRS